MPRLHLACLAALVLLALSAPSSANDRKVCKPCSANETENCGDLKCFQGRCGTRKEQRLACDLDLCSACTVAENCLSGRCRNGRCTLKGELVTVCKKLPCEECTLNNECESLRCRRGRCGTREDQTDAGCWEPALSTCDVCLADAACSSGICRGGRCGNRNQQKLGGCGQLLCESCASSDDCFNGRSCLNSICGNSRQQQQKCSTRPTFTPSPSPSQTDGICPERAFCDLPLEMCSRGESTFDLESLPDEEAYCVDGDEACCDLDPEECRNLVLESALKFQQTVIGETETLTDGPVVPINLILDPAVREQRPGTYDASTLCGKEFSFEVEEILFSSTELMTEAEVDTEQDVLDLAEEIGQEIFVFNGNVEEFGFIGIVASFPTVNNRANAYLFVSSAANFSRDSIDAARRSSIFSWKRESSFPPASSKQSPFFDVTVLRQTDGCSSAFDAALAAFDCPEGQSLTAAAPCRFALVNGCRTDIETAQLVYNAAVVAAQAALTAVEVALARSKAIKLIAVFTLCTGTGPAYALCVANGILVIEAKEYAIELAGQIAYEAAVALAQRNLDTIVRVAYAGVRRGADACFDCECDPSDPCCENDDPCCDDEDPCCGSEDPCCDNEDPCCGSDDPCCGSEDPCCGSEDPCCGSEDDCCGSTDPCCGSPNPCCGSSDSCCGRSCGGAYGDPHFTTFDSYRYSCQARGEFVLFGSPNSGALVQCRFESKSSTVSLATAFAARGDENSPVVQLQVNEEAELELFVDGQRQSNPDNSFENDDVYVVKEFSTITVYFKASDVSVLADVIPLSSFPHLSVRVRLPLSFSTQEVVGLLGSPDDNATNDWTTRNGTILPLATEDFSGEMGYNYCVTHWCVDNSMDSLFVYRGDNDFNSYYGCDQPFAGEVDISDASSELIEICGTDQACLIDGVELGLEGARSLLQTEASLTASPIGSRFQVEPSVLAVGVPTNVILTVNLSAAMEADGIEEYFIYRVDPQTFEVGTTAILSLQDNGIGVGDDQNAGDGIYSNALALNSEFAGESFGFQAVPVINGAPIFESNFVFQRLNAVRSYSSSSGIEFNETTSFFRLSNVGTVDGLIVVVRYSWPADQRDLDTGTFYLNEGAGFGCGSAQYVLFSGDSTLAGGSEEARILVGQAYEDEQWFEGAGIDMFAGWYGALNRGPASITLFTQHELPDGTLVDDDNAITFVITPGEQTGCSSKTVAYAFAGLDFENYGNGDMIIEVTVAA